MRCAMSKLADRLRRSRQHPMPCYAQAERVIKKEVLLDRVGVYYGGVRIRTLLPMQACATQVCSRPHGLRPWSGGAHAPQRCAIRGHLRCPCVPEVHLVIPPTSLPCCRSGG